MELIYYYAKNYKNKPAQFHNLSNEWAAEYDEEKGLLSVIKKEDYIEGFYGENISSITAIIGNNGAGKTTLLNNISRTVLSENDAQQIGYFVFLAVYSKNNKLFCYNFGNIIPIKKVKGISFVTDKIWAEDLKTILTIFFSQHIEPLYSGNIFIKRKEKPDSGRKDISTAYLYYQTVINNSKEVTQVEKLFRKDDYKKYIKLFCNVNLNISLKVPKFINVRVLKRFYDFTEYKKIYKTWSLDNLSNLLYKINAQNVSDISQREIIEQTVYQIISKYHFLKLIPELNFFLLGIDDIINRLESNETYDFEEVTDEILSICPNKHKHYLQDAVKLIKYINKGNSKYLQVHHDGFTLNIENSSARKLLSEMNDSGILDNELDFIEMGFSYSNLEFTTFSSGEYALWAIFSRIYYLKNKLKAHTILLLDEAELNLHPIWQREFINTLLQFLNTNFKNIKFQIVLSSHSPLILSDLPKSAISYLNEDKIDFDNSLPQTFGANIHELYSSGFGLNGNLIGGFASSKIKNLVNVLFEKKTISREEADVYLKTIKLIGEPFIKSKLIERIDHLLVKDDIDFAIKQKEVELKEKQSELMKLKEKRSKKNSDDTN